MALGAPIVILILAILGIALGVFLLVFLIVPIFKGIGWLIKHVFRFVFGMILDVLRLVGSIVTALVMIPLILGNVLVGRWSASAHYGRSLQSELVSGALSIYRVVIGHPARFLLLSAITEGLEKRLPAAVAAAPTTDRPSGRAQQFDGYTIVGSLQAGGSGGKLYVANPDPAKRAAFDRSGHRDVQQVVIKTFSLDDGSELPQIVRESRSLDAAKKLGLVLDHELTNSRFYYAMRYVPGQPLGLVTPQLHAASGGTGLDDRHLALGMGYVSDLLDTLETYHRGGLWHKDVKPDNIIVDQRAHLVDFGLVTPLRSSMTLTTHGTEYFRDPELVRLALKGVKVSEVDGARFDVYAAGAVLYSIIENSFPAHGVLSQVSRRCPEALKWVIRRAMADYDKRYPSAAAMAVDLRCVLGAADPFALKPIDLPSMQGQVPASPRPFEEAAYRPAYVAMPPIPGADRPQGQPFAAQVQAASPVPPAVPAPGGAAGRGRTGMPRISIKNWWTGEFSIAKNRPVHAAPIPPFSPSPAAPQAPFVQQAAFTPIPAIRRSAAEQLNAARSRAAAARQRASDRISRRAGRSFSSEPNAGVFMALFFFLGVCVLIVGAIVAVSLNGARRNAASQSEANYDGGWANVIIPVPPAPPAEPSAGTNVEYSSSALPEVDTQGDQAAGSVFVWVDLQRPLSTEHETAIREITGSLADMGFTVIGEVPGLELPAQDRDHVVEMTAQLMAASSALPWDSAPARETIAQWAGSVDGVDMVLRFHSESAKDGGGASKTGPIGCSIVIRSSEDPEERRHLLDGFSSVQRVLQRGNVD